MPTAGTAVSTEKLRSKVESLKPWFHNLHLPGGIQTAPGHYFGDFPKFKWDQVKDSIPQNLDGMTALDIGCNAGFYSFELAKRGATVLGIDLDPHYLKQAKWAAKTLGLEDKVKFRQMQVYDLAKLKRSFDIIIFMGVFYHLRYPMLALDIVAQKVKKMMVFQTLTMPGDDIVYEENIEVTQRNKMLKQGWPKMAFIESKFAGDVTNWFTPNHACILAMLRTCGMKVTSMPGHEIYIAQPDDAFTNVAKTWNHSEYLSAIGQDYTELLDVKVKRKE
ncbi:TIGR04290 family methyltransferase [Aridibaculum aurantiacum]|uniref:TIGR04290 family methyltransferase n=1 Tax=Aridibaculum aurantiacum TaxID=2810307 RepID=UPI001A971CC1|nr:TIGR04290 family methyltransferase [Aridibaculum aurantiacum]